MSIASKIFLLLSIAMVAACSVNRESYLPVASGRTGEVVMLIDSNQWNSSLGDTLKDYLRGQVKGLPRPEPHFDLIRVHPTSSSSLHRQTKNLLFVFTLDQKTNGARNLRSGFDESILKRIASDSSYHLAVTDNLFAKDQKVMYLFGRTQEELADFISKNHKQILDYFDEADLERLKRTNARSNNKITAAFNQQTGLKLQLAEGFQLADKDETFFWYRKFHPMGKVFADMNIFVSWEPYTDQDQFDYENIINWRNKIAGQYLFGDPERPLETPVITEMEVPFAVPISAIKEIDGQYAVQLKGLWKTKNNSRGGPFLSYTFMDPATNNLFYVEAFLYSPATDQREFMREMDAMISMIKLGAKKD